MNETQNNIKHDGIILNLKENIASVRVLVHSGCSSCQVKSACGIAEDKEKILQIPVGNNEYKTGDKVVVSMARSLGYKAMFYGYLLPFLVILASLLIGSAFIGDEGLIAGTALLITMVYYAILYTQREKFKRVFTYRIDHTTF